MVGNSTVNQMELTDRAISWSGYVLAGVGIALRQLCLITAIFCGLWLLHALIIGSGVLWPIGIASACGAGFMAGSGLRAAGRAMAGQDEG